MYVYIFISYKFNRVLTTCMLFTLSVHVNCQYMCMLFTLSVHLVHMYIDWKNTKSMDDVNRGNKKDLIISDVYARQASYFSLYRMNSH